MKEGSRKLNKRENVALAVAKAEFCIQRPEVLLDERAKEAIKAAREWTINKNTHQLSRKLAEVKEAEEEVFDAMVHGVGYEVETYYATKAARLALQSVKGKRRKAARCAEKAVDIANFLSGLKPIG